MRRPAHVSGRICIRPIAPLGDTDRVALARVSLNPASPKFDLDTILLRGKQLGNTFSVFHERGWLTQEFADNLINLLEAWSSGGGRLSPVLPDKKYFDEVAFFGKAIHEPSALDYTQLVHFAAFVFYLRYHEGRVNPIEMNEWMRVVRNLAVNSDIERPEEYGRCLTGLLKLLTDSSRILEHFSATDVGQIGFSPQQVREEVLKAKLILANSAWRTRIDNAEAHGYFSGQIDFILDFSGVSAKADEEPVTKWELGEHEQRQAAFDRYLKKAQFTFTTSGLASTKPTAAFLWERALLTYGNYLVSIGRNLSFVTDPPSNSDSWKRFLRGGGNGKREHLKVLWDRIDMGSEIEPQLNQIIASASDSETWRAAIVKHPKVIAYCGQREIRCENNFDLVYLLQKRQMNGAHAELYSYVLYLELDSGDARRGIAPLVLQPYRSVTMTEVEPHVLLTYSRPGHQVSFAVESMMGQFRVYVRLAELEVLPDLGTALCALGQYSAHADTLVRWVPRRDIHQMLQELANILANLSN